MLNVLNVLVDYDNLSSYHQNLSLKYLCERILLPLSPDEIKDINTVKIRLYGGWYIHKNLTRKAQKLSGQISSTFPYFWNNSNNKYIITVELAYSLLITPREHLLDTYRIHEYPTGIYCINPSNLGCKDPTCPIHNVYDFINKDSIAGQCCTIQPKDLIKKGAQKLVDTMLSMDIYYLSSKEKEPIILVSSDDDFWPCIRSSLVIGRKIIHIHTKMNYTMASHYTKFAGPNYVQKNIT